MHSLEKILVIGASGQMGAELTLALRHRYGGSQVIAADIQAAPPILAGTGKFVHLNVLNKDSLLTTIKVHNIRQIYLLAAMLSATGELHPQAAWDLNMKGLLNVLELSQQLNLTRVFWPSSIAALSPASTVYGISKCAGELWCQYYHAKFGLDVRSIRYPGLISYQAPPGGGTTDYAIDIFHAAVKKKHYRCFLKKDTALPMLYMPDAIRATLQLMTTPAEKIHTRTAYNVAGMSFTPAELFDKIRRFAPEFTISYEPDHRQTIAESWPAQVDDEAARRDWGWTPAYELTLMTNDMLVNLEKMHEHSRPVCTT